MPLIYIKISKNYFLRIKYTIHRFIDLIINQKHRFLLDLKEANADILFVQKDRFKIDNKLFAFHWYLYIGYTI